MQALLLLAVALAPAPAWGLNENDDERAQWPIPNVVGVRAR